MTRLTELPPHCIDAIETGFIRDGGDSVPPPYARKPYLDDRKEIVLAWVNDLLASEKARIVTGGRGRQGENDLIINLGLEKPHDT